MNEAQLKAIKVCIEKGDKAKQKEDDFYIAAGQHLKTLQAAHKERGGTWAEWEALLKGKCGIGKSRASKLVQIAESRKTVEQIRERASESMRDGRAKQISPQRCGETEPHPDDDRLHPHPDDRMLVELPDDETDEEANRVFGPHLRVHGQVCQWLPVHGPRPTAWLRQKLGLDDGWRDWPPAEDERGDAV
jgi:hypothetical protein